MWPLLQVVCRELPYCPPLLKKIALMTVFIEADDLPTEVLPAPNGQGWLLRAYPTLEDLTPLSMPPIQTHIKPFPIRWELGKPEGPDWDDAWIIAQREGFEPLLDAFNELDLTHPGVSPTDLYYDRYTRHRKTKIGGWPSYIQSGPLKGKFAFQIGSEKKANWMWADDGNGYISRKNKEWLLYWDCY